LDTRDINGARPGWNDRLKTKKIFIEKSTIKEIFGQKGGNYHGYKEDLANGGTYNPNPRNQTIVNDLQSYTKFKLK